MPVLIAALLIAAIIAAFAVGILRFQKKEPSRGRERGSGEPFFDMGAPEPQEEEEPAPLVDLVDYYADYEPEVPAEPEAPRFVETEEQFDRLCNLKVGRGYLMDCQNFLLSMAESGQKFVLCYFDFNRFRFINTLRGFSTGDYALTRIVQDARAIFPDGAMFTRLSADHFAVLTVYIDEAQIQELVEQLKRGAERIRGDVGAKSGLQISMGVALTNSPADYDIFKLMRRANIARHCLKLTKAETYSLYDSSMLSTFLYGESAVDDYNEHQYADDFVLYLRPQLSLTSKRITACDSMVRWAYEDTNDSAPVEDGNILPGTNLKVAYHALRTMSRWRKAGNIPIPITVTLGEIDFYKEDIDAFFVRCVGEFQLEPGMVTVAISLHTLRIEPELARIQMKKLADVGVKTAVCDIDRGTQKLDSLEGMPISFLRLHKSFAHDAERLPERRQDVERIIALASGLGAGTVFEGVDNVSCLGVIAEAGGTLAQGRYVGRVSKVDAFTEEMAGFLKGGPVDPNATVVLDDLELNKGNFNLY